MTWASNLTSTTAPSATVDAGADRFAARGTPPSSSPEATAARALLAYQSAIQKLAPVWSPLPIGPYPPASDTTNFPRSGTPNLTITQAQVTAAQLAEPGKITQALHDQAIARRPKLNVAFVVGLGCIAAFFILRD